MKPLPKPIKVRKMKLCGQLDFRLVEPDSWAESVREMQERIPGLVLPTLQQLGLDTKKGRKKDWWLLLSPVTILVEFEGRVVMDLELAPGYMTDFASVPPAFRSIMHNTRTELRKAALVHDCLYARQLAPWGEANTIFREMILTDGGSRTLATLAWAAVSTPVGWNCYRFTEDWEVALHKITVAMVATEQAKIYAQD